MWNRYLGLSLFAASIGMASTGAAQRPPASRTPRYAIAPVDTLNLPMPAAAFNQLDDAAGLFDARAARSDSIKSTIAGIRRSVDVLRRQWAKLDPSRRTVVANPVGFRVGLVYDIAVLRAASADTSSPDVLAVLRETSHDLAEKAEHCVRSPSGMASLVDVNVRTWFGRTESAGWQVFYMPKIMEFAADQAAATMPFRKFSSPAVEALAPGRYLIWARQPGPNGATSERTILRVGGGVASLSQDIAVPR